MIYGGTRFRAFTCPFAETSITGDLLRRAVIASAKLPPAACHDILTWRHDQTPPDARVRSTQESGREDRKR